MYVFYIRKYLNKFRSSWHKNSFKLKTVRPCTVCRLTNYQNPTNLRYYQTYKCRRLKRKILFLFSLFFSNSSPEIVFISIEVVATLTSELFVRSNYKKCSPYHPFTAFNLNFTTKVNQNGR